MIRWVFYFDGEGTVKSDILDEKEDARIAKVVRKHGNSFWGTKAHLRLPAPTTDIYINLDMVKCITRERVADDVGIPKAETPLPDATSIPAAA